MVKRLIVALSTTFLIFSLSGCRGARDGGDVTLKGSEEKLRTVKEADILWVRTEHQEEAIYVKVKFRELTRGRDLELRVTVKTMRGRDTTIAVLPQRGYPHPGRSWSESEGCRRAITHVSYWRERLEVVVPRFCLGNPRYISASATASSWGAGGEERVDWSGKNDDAPEFTRWDQVDF
jgi:hypothetical protein